MVARLSLEDVREALLELFWGDERPPDAGTVYVAVTPRYDPHDNGGPPTVDEFISRLDRR